MLFCTQALFHSNILYDVPTQNCNVLYQFILYNLTSRLHKFFLQVVNKKEENMHSIRKNKEEKILQV